ncbi:MAG: hypothetical protein ACRCZP_00515, partial [Phycicoccus sp.]
MSAAPEFDMVIVVAVTAEVSTVGHATSTDPAGASNVAVVCAVATLGATRAGEVMTATGTSGHLPGR